MGFIDESANSLVLPPGEPPPPAILPQVTGLIGQAVDRLRDGKSGFVFVHEKTQDGSINQTHGVFVQRFGEDVVATLWVGREWNKPGTVGFGASLIWELD